MEWCIVIGVAGRIIVIKIGPGRLLLANSYSATSLTRRSGITEQTSERKQYAETLIPMPMANGPMVVLDQLLHFSIQGDSRCIMYVHSKVSLIIIIMLLYVWYAGSYMQCML